MNALAVRLAEHGKCPTQIHFDGQAPQEWDWCGQHAALFSYADESHVVTSDGVIHKP